MDESQKADLLKTVDVLRGLIVEDHYSESQMTDILDTTKAYVNDEWSIDSNLVKYLFTGWFLHTCDGGKEGDEETFKPSAKSAKRTNNNVDR